MTVLPLVVFVPLVLASSPVKASPSHTRSPEFYEAERMLTEGRLNDAASLYLDLLRRDPTDGEILLRLARIYSWTDRQREAIRTYQKALENGRFSAATKDSVVIESALVLGWSGRYEEAFRVLDGNGASSSRAHAVRGDLYSWMEEFEKAERAYSKALMLDSKDETALAGLERLEGNPRHSLRSAERRMCLSEGDPEAAAHYLRLLLESGGYYRAQGLADSLLRSGIPDSEGKIREIRADAAEQNRLWVREEVVRREIALREAMEKQEGLATLDALQLEYAEALEWSGKYRDAFGQYRQIQDRGGKSRAAREGIIRHYHWAGHSDWARHELAGEYFEDESISLRERATPGYKYVYDSDSFRKRSFELVLSKDLGFGNESLMILGRSLYDQAGEEDEANSLGIRARHLWKRGISFRGSYRFVSYREAGASHEWSAGAGWLKEIQWNFLVSFARSDLIDRSLTIAAVRDGPVQEDSWEGSVAWTPDGRLRVEGRFRFLSVSDGNSGLDGSGNVSVALLESPHLSLRYRATYLGYREKTVVYWSPSRHLSHRGGLLVSWDREAWHAELEGALGRDRSDGTRGLGADLFLSLFYQAGNHLGLETSLNHGKVVRDDGSYWASGFEAALNVSR